MGITIDGAAASEGEVITLGTIGVDGEVDLLGSSEGIVLGIEGITLGTEGADGIVDCWVLGGTGVFGAHSTINEPLIDCLFAAHANWVFKVQPGGSPVTVKHSDAVSKQLQ